MARRKETAEAPDARRFANLLFEIVDQIGPGRLERGAETEQQRSPAGKTGMSPRERRASGVRSTTNEKFTELSKRASECSRRLLHQTLRMSPTTPPQIASNKPSASNCRTIRQRDAPRARRSAISFDARGAAGQQHVGEIQTSDEQNGAGHAHQQRADQRDRAVVFGRRAQAESRRLLNLHFARKLGIGRLNGIESLR